MLYGWEWLGTGFVMYSPYLSPGVGREELLELLGAIFVLPQQVAHFGGGCKCSPESLATLHF